MEKRVVLISGANQGIGLQIAKDLAAKGLTVLMGARNLELGQAAQKEVGHDSQAIQLDVTDPHSMRAAAALIRSQFGRLDVLVNNAAISNTNKKPGESIADYGKRTVASKAPMDEVRAVWETNAFGPLALYQAMFPLLSAAPFANVVNVSSAVGSLTLNSEPSFPYRKGFSAIYSVSKTAMNAMTVAMVIECEPTKIKVNACSPGFTNTALNGNEGTETVQQGASEAVRLAMLGADAPMGTFTHATMGSIPW